jgi:hypothetical protein
MCLFWPLYAVHCWHSRWYVCRVTNNFNQLTATVGCVHLGPCGWLEVQQ